MKYVGVCKTLNYTNVDCLNFPQLALEEKKRKKMAESEVHVDEEEVAGPEFVEDTGEEVVYGTQQYSLDPLRIFAASARRVSNRNAGNFEKTKKKNSGSFM